VLPESSIKLGRSHMILPGLLAGLLAGLLVTPLVKRQAIAPSVSQLPVTSFDIARLSPAELETLAFSVLTTLREKRGLATNRGLGAEKDSPNELLYNPRQIHLGMENVRRLLPLAKKLTLESLRERLKTTGLLREKRLIDSVNQVVLDWRLGDAAEVREENLTIIHIGPKYAASLTSDEEAILLLGHELTHVAARTGRLNQFIGDVTETARLNASIELGERQKEELACDFIGAEALKLFIALHPTGEAKDERLARAFGYEPPSERLARAWQVFCASYNGDPEDEDHLSQDHTIRALLGLDPELKAFVPDDATSTSFCR
jgi:hypothetical protein